MSEASAELKWHLHCDFSQPQGELYSQFMAGLKEQKILGTRIGDKRYFPVKQFCELTYQEPDEVIESDGVARVDSFTIYHTLPERVAFPNATLRLNPPYILAALTLQNSAQSFLHFLGGVDVNDPGELLNRVKQGLYVKPVWSDERHGNLLDIIHFEPV